MNKLEYETVRKNREEKMEWGYGRGKKDQAKKVRKKIQDKRKEERKISGGGKTKQTDKQLKGKLTKRKGGTNRSKTGQNKIQWDQL